MKTLPIVAPEGYKISGIERRQLKKHLAHLKYFVKNYHWQTHLDRDMCSFVGCSGERLVDNETLDKVKNEIKTIENKLIETAKPLL